MLPRELVACVLVLSAVPWASAQTSAPRKASPRKAGAPLRPAEKKVEPPGPPDLAIHSTYTTGAQVSVNRTYLKGARQRFEFPGLTLIAQCDGKRTVQVNDAARRFMVASSTPPAPSAPRVEAAEDEATLDMPAGAGGPAAAPRGGMVVETTTLTDTGERKPMFGFEARRVKTVTVRQPDANACDQAASRVETDGWYADLPERSACVAAPAPPVPAAGTGCSDRLETRQVGEAKLGFALRSTITTTTDEGKDVRTVDLEVTDLKVGPLDAALFEVPPGYTEVKTHPELLPALADGSSVAEAVFGSLSNGTSTVAPKKPGVIRIGVAAPVNKSGRPLPVAMLRGNLVASLGKAPFEALPVTGATPAEVDRDAAGKACDFVLHAEVAELKTSKPNKVGGMLRRVSGDASVPSEVHNARVHYTLNAVGVQGKPRLAAEAKASSGGGFGVGSALRVAKFAGSLYLGMTARGMLGGGMMGPYSSFMGGGGGLAARVMNPGLGAAASVMSQAMGAPGMGVPGMGLPGMEDASSQRATQTVHEALSKAGKQVAEELKKKGRS
ncbi:MAG TPA: hypothetical protein VII13_17965 [Vicinamibacteria bacterium]